MGRKSIGWKNLWSLTVLVFLRLKPMHPYELQSIIKLTHKDDFLRLKPGSLYNAIARLLQAGLIEVAETSREGKRPERTVYRNTAAGSRELVDWLRDLLSTPGPDPVQFYAALSFLPALDPKDVVQQLLKRVELLDAEIAGHRHVLTMIAAKIGRLHLLEVEYTLAVRSAERRWVAEVIADLQAGKLDWNPEILRKIAAQMLHA